MNSKNLEVLSNIIGAVESGGQIYGNKNYSSYAAPYTNTPNEHTITLGWQQSYGSEANKLISNIFKADQALFRKLDTCSPKIESMLSKDWVSIKWNPSSSQKKVLINLISSDVGKKCQDELFYELMNKYIARAKSYGITDVKLQMMWCEIQHLGGLTPTLRVFKRIKYNNNATIDDVFNALLKDQNDTSSSNQVGDKIFQSRHECCVKWIKMYAVDDDGDSDINNGYLQRGDNGTEVADMQRKLIACGYSVGFTGADGDFGDNTLAAIELFQVENGLTVTGIYDENTKAKLEAMYNSIPAEAEVVITEDNITICGHGSGRPSTKNMKTYLSQRYSQYASNGKHKGVVCVRRLKGMTDTKRQQFHDYYETILGRNVYSQSLREYVYTPYKGTYYSDCSSSGCFTFAKLGFSSVKYYNTAEIYYGSEFETVPVKIKNGHITNPEVLMVGDAIMFVGNDSSRPLQIGHVEYVYEMPSNFGNTVHETETSYGLEDASSKDDSLSGEYTVNEALNIRYGAGTNKSKLGTLKTGDTVKCCGYYTTVNDTKWFLVCSTLGSGYVSSRYLTKVKTEDDTTESVLTTEESTTSEPSIKNITVDKFIDAIDKVYKTAHDAKYSYGDSKSIPPTSDCKISCDRIIAKAMYDLGFTDQPDGGITVGNMESYLTKWGLTKNTSQSKVQRGDIILFKQDGTNSPTANWHSFVVTDYDNNTKKCSKYDMGSQTRIESIQPFTNVNFDEWASKSFYAAFTGFKKTTSTTATTTTVTTNSTVVNTTIDKNAKVEPAVSYDKSIAGTYTITEALNIRAGAGTDKVKLGTLKANTKAKCYGYYTEVDGKKWLYVIADGIKGFISSKYVKK